MTQKLETAQQAVNLLLQGVQLAQKRGAYDLNEASALQSAVSFLSTPPTAEAEAEQPDEPVEMTVHVPKKSKK